MDHIVPVPYGPKSCSHRFVRARTGITIPAGESLVFLGNPCLGFLNEIQNADTTGAAGVGLSSLQPGRSAAWCYRTGIGLSAADIMAGPNAGWNGTALVPEFAFTTFADATSSTNGSGYFRWLGTRLVVREISTRLEEGGSVYWNNGSTGQSTVGWISDNSSVASLAGMSQSYLRDTRLAAAYPLTGRALVLGAVPSTPDDMIFRDVPRSMASVVNGGAAAVSYAIDQEIMPEQPGTVANDSWRLSLVVDPASASAVEIELEFISHYELHYYPEATPVIASLSPLQLAQPDTHIRHSDPSAAAAHANTTAVITTAKNFGRHPPPTYDGNSSKALTWIEDLVGGGLGALGLSRFASMAGRAVSRGARAAVSDVARIMGPTISDGLPMLTGAVGL